jgi:calcineurin-like phosphoesterase family protein
MRLDINLTQDKEERNVFFTSDFHCHHNNVLKFDNRPFEDINEMHIALEERWNEVVEPNDIVIYLGDLDFAKREDKAYVEGMMYRLNGTIHFVMGNHDKYADIKKIGKFASVNDYLEVRIKTNQVDKTTGFAKPIETLFCCMHYPIFEWNKKHNGSYHIHGHCHMNLFNNDKDWLSDINKFSRYVPKDELDIFNKLISDRHYYRGRVFDVGCMGWDYKPVSFKDILKLGENN